jgi:hypothetical protein
MERPTYIYASTRRRERMRRRLRRWLRLGDLLPVLLLVLPACALVTAALLRFAAQT